MKKPRRPDESQLLAFLDEELTPQRQAEIRQQLAADWELRAQLAKLERRVEQFVDATAGQETDESLPMDDWWQDFSQRLAATGEKPVWQARMATEWRLFLAQLAAWWQPETRWRLALGATASLLVVMTLALFIWRAERPVSAQEFLQRTTQAEAASLRSVGEPVVYRKIQLKRSDSPEAVLWESWNDARHKQFRQRVADQQGLRFLRAEEKTTPTLMAELEPLLRANHFDPQHPLSPAAFAEWRKTLAAKSETVMAQGHEWKLTTIASPPYAVNAIAEAALVVRRSDWHAVALHLKVQSENELREYTLSELAYEVLPLQALTVFADLPPTLMPTPAPAITPKESLPPAVVAASPTPTTALPSLAALQAAEVEALYALHQAKADLGEQLEVVREDGRHIVVRGLVQTATRKEELSQLLHRIALVKPQILTIDEAVQQAQRAAPANTETVSVTNETAVTSTSATPTVNAFQQRLIEQFGGRKGLSDAEREEVNARVTQFYNGVEADASAAMAEAWALRRLQERFVTATNADLDGASRQRLDEMLGNHTARLRQRVQSLQARLRPQLVALVNDVPAVSPSTEATRAAKIQAVFRAVEQVSRLTDQLIAGQSATLLQQTARALLTEFARLDAALSDLEKN
jgi:hypothetical protein